MRVLAVVFSAIACVSSFAFAQEQIQKAVAEPDAKQSKSTVYIYRYKQFVGSALSPSVYCDEVQLARMENGRYFEATVDPGQHTFRSNDAQSGVQLELKPGQEYFIRVEIAAGMMKGHGRLILNAPEQGRYELQSKKLKPLDADKVFDKSHVSVEEANFDRPNTPPASTPTAVATPNSAAAAAATTATTAATKTAAEPPSTQSQTAGTEHHVEGTTIEGTSDAGGEVSLGEAARRARLKKASTSSATTPPQ
jgi:hypothetical protein